MNKSLKLSLFLYWKLGIWIEVDKFNLVNSIILCILLIKEFVRN